MMDFFFHFSAISVTPFWLAMIFFPHSQRVKTIIRSPWIILPAVICYLYFLLPNIIVALGIFDSPSPQKLQKITSELWAASLLWAYAGAFDLFVGRWIFFDTHERGISFWLVSPILFICILFGPLGFFLYSIVCFGYYLKQSPKLNSETNPEQ